MRVTRGPHVVTAHLGRALSAPLAVDVGESAIDVVISVEFGDDWRWYAFPDPVIDLHVVDAVGAGGG